MLSDKNYQEGCMRKAFFTTWYIGTEKNTVQVLAQQWLTKGQICSLLLQCNTRKCTYATFMLPKLVCQNRQNNSVLGPSHSIHMVYQKDGYSHRGILKKWRFRCKYMEKYCNLEACVTALTAELLVRMFALTSGSLISIWLIYGVILQQRRLRNLLLLCLKDTWCLPDSKDSASSKHSANSTHAMMTATSDREQCGKGAATYHWV